MTSIRLRHWALAWHFIYVDIHALLVRYYSTHSYDLILLDSYHVHAATRPARAKDMAASHNGDASLK